MSRDVYCCNHWLETPHLGSYTRGLLISQDKRYLFVTPFPLTQHMRRQFWNLQFLHMESISPRINSSKELISLKELILRINAWVLERLYIWGSAHFSAFSGAATNRHHSAKMDSIMSTYSSIFINEYLQYRFLQCSFIFYSLIDTNWRFFDNIFLTSKSKLWLYCISCYDATVKDSSIFIYLQKNLS